MLVTDKLPATDEGSPGRLVGFTLTAAVVGAATGLVASTFTVLLRSLARLRVDAAHRVHGELLGLILFVAVAAAATSLAAWLVHRLEPHAEGSGIPRVEAIAQGRMAPGRFRILPIKYAGGLLAIGSGLALGREGPSVQMGANIAAIAGHVTRRSMYDIRILIAGGAAAGLATAFNAPIAGGAFVLEELLRRFDSRTTIATLVASGSGFAAAHLVQGNDTDFHLAALATPQLAQAPLVLCVGLATGLIGVVYNRLIMGALLIADTHPMPVEARAALIGGSIGAIGWLAPSLVGGGDNLTQSALLGEGTILGICGVLALRIGLGVVSYAALTPGGLFAPMLVLGTHIGLLVGLIADAVLPMDRAPLAGLALAGMAAFFTATVRAPITGIILATEMTGSATWLAPMLGACAVAMLVATVLRSEPIYDALTTRAARAAAWNARRSSSAQRPATD